LFSTALESKLSCKQIELTNKMAIQKPGVSAENPLRLIMAHVTSLSAFCFFYQKYKMYFGQGKSGR